MAINFFIMKAIYTLFIFLSFFACKEANSENKHIHKANIEASALEEADLAGDTSVIIAKIRTQYQSIKADSAKDTHQILEAECDGLFGNASFQSQNGKIRKISYLYGSDHGGITEEYYFQDEVLFFIFVEEGSWMFDPNDSEKTIDEVIQTRYYVDNNQIIRAMRKQVKVPTAELEKKLSSAKNEILKGEKLEEWQKKVQELREVAKSKKLEPYLCK